MNPIYGVLQIGIGGSQQSSSPLFDPGALSLALTNVVDKLHRKNKQVHCLSGIYVLIVLQSALMM